jgi:hypothetical protein
MRLSPDIVRTNGFEIPSAVSVLRRGNGVIRPDSRASEYAPGDNTASIFVDAQRASVRNTEVS